MEHLRFKQAQQKRRHSPQVEGGVEHPYFTSWTNIFEQLNKLNVICSNG